MERLPLFGEEGGACEFREVLCVVKQLSQRSSAQLGFELNKLYQCPRMIDVRAWAEYVVEWAAKDPYGFLTTVILALTPLFIASALLSWKLAKMIEARDREQKKKQKRQENIAKAKRTKKD
ncbi:hypothetical protein L3Q82_023227 [Scortum barcoo]|uniref:Uncharacterized protein n=1 Tax=Scortum barcoo TaxID=214431 RepID=A0ACB8WZ83_9TELE|nr:hypothetical protein L3Q82_023227 [Scortum barcoo]